MTYFYYFPGAVDDHRTNQMHNKASATCSCEEFKDRGQRRFAGNQASPASAKNNEHISQHPRIPIGQTGDSLSIFADREESKRR